MDCKVVYNCLKISFDFGKFRASDRAEISITIMGFIVTINPASIGEVIPSPSMNVS